MCWRFDAMVGHIGIDTRRACTRCLAPLGGRRTTHGYFLCESCLAKVRQAGTLATETPVRTWSRTGHKVDHIDEPESGRDFRWGLGFRLRSGFALLGQRDFGDRLAPNPSWPLQYAYPKRYDDSLDEEIDQRLASIRNSVKTWQRIEHAMRRAKTKGRIAMLKIQYGIRAGAAVNRQDGMLHIYTWGVGSDGSASAGFTMCGKPCKGAWRRVPDSQWDQPPVGLGRCPKCAKAEARMMATAGVSVGAEA